jgi:histidine phosphotransferase ChpT
MRMDAQLARLLCARLCHDLGGAVGTLSGTLDLAGEGDAEMHGLARDTAAGLGQRLRLYAAAWGGAAEDTDAAELSRLLAGSPVVPRVQFRLEHLAPGGPIPAALVPLLLNAAMLAAEALPRGGTVTLVGSAEDGFVVSPEGRNAAWPAGLLGLLSGGDLMEALREGPRRVVAPLLLCLAAEAGWAASLVEGPGEGVPPLLLGPV